MENMDKGLTVPKWVQINRLKIPKIPQKFSAQFVCPSPKVWDFDKRGFIDRLLSKLWSKVYTNLKPCLVLLNKKQMGIILLNPNKKVSSKTISPHCESERRATSRAAFSVLNSNYRQGAGCTRDLRRFMYSYGNTGCGVFKRGIQD